MKAKGCNSCYFKRKQFVGSRGNPEAPIVFVGEGPGATELAKGLPFMGPSGKVLESTLPDSLTPEDYYVTNAMQCLPRRTKDTALNTKRVREGVRCCRDRLLAEIGEYPRKVIVAMGNAALWGLTGDYDWKITQERGKVFPHELAEVGIVATVHPAFLLRGGGSYHKYKSDISYALDLAAGGALKKPVDTSYELAGSIKDVHDFIDRTFETSAATEDPIIGADIETGGFDTRTDEILCLGWAADPSQVFIVPEELMETDALKYRDFDLAGINGGAHQWCWHNGKFDVGFMRAYGFRSGVDHDTMLMSYTMEERSGFHDLEQVATDEIGAPNYKGMLDPYLAKKSTSYREIPKHILYKYLALDVRNTKQMSTPMYRRILADTRNTTLYHEVLLPASDLLSDVQKNGIRVDFNRVKENTKYYQELIKKEEIVLDRISMEVRGKPINPASPQQMSDLLYNRLKLSKRVEGTGEFILERLPQHPAVKALRAHRKVAKAYNTYVKKLYIQVSDDSKVHSTFLLHGTTTGRLASRGPNMQNQPRGSRVRGQFIPEDGNVFLELDYNQAELRCLGALSNDEELCRIYEDDELSLHKEVSLTLWDDTWEERYKIDDPENPDFVRAYEEYMRTKALNFGIVYGREAPSIAEEFDTSRDEAQEWLDMWAERFPDAWAYIKRCRAAPAKGLNLVTPFGRRKRVGVVSRDQLKDLQNEAANFPHQSIASDLTLLSAVEMRPQLAKWDVKIINLIHDAILFELPYDLELVAKVVTYGTEVMERKPLEWGIDRIPFKAESKLGLRWGDLKEWYPN